MNSFWIFLSFQWDPRTLGLISDTWTIHACIGFGVNRKSNSGDSWQLQYLNEMVMTMVYSNFRLTPKSDACGGKFIFKTVSVFIWCETKIGYGIIRYIFRWYCWTKSWNWTDDHICNCPCPMSEMSTPEYLIYVRVLVWLRVSPRVCVCRLRISHLVLAKWRMSLSLLEN